MNVSHVHPTLLEYASSVSQSSSLDTQGRSSFVSTAIQLRPLAGETRCQCLNPSSRLLDLHERALVLVARAASTNPANADLMTFIKRYPSDDTHP